VYQKKKALIVVRTYPTPSRKGVEVSCTAAITEQGEWLRLFPVPYRLLENDQRFRKYQWVEVDVERALKDPRPESHKLAHEGIRILSEPLSTSKSWQARRAIVDPLEAHCLCCVQKKRDQDGYPTLALVKPAFIQGLIIEDEDSPEWSPAQQAALRQGHLFQQGPAQELEKIPFKFSYRFKCEEPDCNGHKLMCTDWEMGEAWRKWSRAYGPLWESKFRERFEIELTTATDLKFFVGTVHAHPDAWIIVGLYYPPPLSASAELQGQLF
jgi:hypothetical protein